MSNSSDPPGDSEHLGKADGTASDPLPESRRDVARRKKALRRVTGTRKDLPWLKRLPRIIFPLYGYMRSNDPNYEEHEAHWEEQQRENYEE